MKRYAIALWTGCVLLGFTYAQAADVPVDADILLQGATIHDGAGSPATVGDVAIRGDKIVAVGKFAAGRVGRTIDCTGLVVAPGFIDLHNHSDRQVIDRRTRAVVNYLLQGCTTIVTGNCGSGPIDVADFYDKIDAAGAGTNVAHLLPQGRLRDAVLGTAQRSPTKDELQRMKQLAEKAMQDGAWGMSTGLIYVPSSYADTDEITAIAKVVAASGGIYVSHIRNENVELLAAVNEAMKIGRAAGMPVHISHFKSSGRDSWGLVRRAADMIEQAQKLGQKVTADQYPYIASSTSLDATLIPTWARAGGRAELIARFDDEQLGARIRQSMRRNLEKRNGGETIQISRYAKHPEWAGKRLSEIAKAENIEPLELAIRISRNGGAGIVNFSMDEADVRHIMQRRWVATASDGRAYLPGADKPHPRSYGTFARKLGYYSIREQVLPLEQAVRSSTGLPAEILGLTDRGYVRVGLAADIVVFDPKTFIDRATFQQPHQYSAGVKFVFVNGRPAVFNGQPTGALAGKSLRHESKTESE
jgi:N-acyl-D-aspartate/D-glutamate deacylase